MREMSLAQNHSHVGHYLYPNGAPNGGLGVLSRGRTPTQSGQQLPESEQSLDDDPRSKHFRELFARAEAKIEALFGDGPAKFGEDAGELGRAGAQGPGEDVEAENTKAKASVKKAARAIDEEDYDDSEEEEDIATSSSPLKGKGASSKPIQRVPSPAKIPGIPPSPALTSIQGPTSQWQGKSTDYVRKRLEEDKKSAEDAAKRSFATYFYPLDNDRDTMLEQQRLEESDRQVDVEMSGQGHGNTNSATEGTLSQANLGTSSLVLKHLIARIDAKRDQVLASDQELRNLMIEVKKNRSKWANEDKVGQEELYEAADKVLSEIKAQTEHSQPFLQRVNKREAPDYYQGTVNSISRSKSESLRITPSHQTSNGFEHHDEEA